MNIVVLIKDKIFKNEFNKNVLILAGGTAVAQAVPVLISPILTRLYTPENFGAFAIFVSITSIISAIACVRYELAIILPAKDEDAINVAAVAFLFNVFISTLFLLFILFFGDWLLGVLNAKNLGWLIYLAPLSVFLMGIFNILNYTNNRFKLYRDITIANIYRSMSGATVQLVLGFFKLEIGLILGQVFTQIVAVGRLFKNVRDKFDFSKFNKKNLIIVMYNYKQFPLSLLPIQIFDLIRSYGLNFILLYFYGSQNLGLFYLSQRVLQIPLTIISGSISQVYYQNIVNNEKPYNFTMQIYKKLLILFLPVFFIIILIPDSFFLLLFGEKWVDIGKIIKFLLPWISLNFFSSFLSFSLIAKNRHKIQTIWSLIYTLLVICVAIFFTFLDFLDMILVLSICIGIFLLVYIFFVLIFLKKLQEEPER